MVKRFHREALQQLLMKCKPATVSIDSLPGHFFPGKGTLLPLKACAKGGFPPWWIAGLIFVKSME
jgi:hypothetical protein